MVDGGFVIADGPVVERVFPDGAAQVVAGIGKPVYNAVSGPATSTGLADATAVAPEPDGSVLIADENTDRIRKLDPAARLSTVAGSGTGQLQVTVGSDTCRNPHVGIQWNEFYLDPPYGAGLPSLTRRPINVKFTSSLSAAIVLSVRQQDRLITQTQGTFRAGTHTVKLGKPPAPGSYGLALSGTTELNNRVLHACADSLLNVVRG